MWNNNIFRLCCRGLLTLQSVSIKRLQNSRGRFLSTNTKKPNYDLEMELRRLGYFNTGKGRSLFTNRCLNKIMITAGCEKEQAQELIEKYPLLLLDEIDETMVKFKDVESSGFLTTNQLLNAFWLFTFDTGKIKERLEQLESLGFSRCTDEFVAALQLNRLSDSEFKKICAQISSEAGMVPDPFPNRFFYFADLLECPLDVIISEFLKNREIIYRRFDFIRDTCLRMLAYGLKKEDIVNDLGSLKYSARLVEKKFQLAKNYKIERLMPWMIRSSFPSFEKALKIQEDKLNGLEGSKSIEEFLSKKLNIGMDVVELMKYKFPNITSIHARKLKPIIELLLAEGYTGPQICLHPRVLAHSLYTVQERLAEQRELGLCNPPLFILCASERNYQEFIMRLMLRSRHHSGNKSLTLHDFEQLQ